MDLYTLKVFFVVCKHKSFTKAGEQLYISQSAVSMQIKKLENFFQTTLIKRDSKNFRLTYAGKRLQKRVEEIFLSISKMENEIKSIIADEDTKIVIGATHNIGEPILPTIIKEYLLINPNIKFELMIKNSKSLWEYLKRGEIDIILTDDIAQADDNFEYIDTDDYPFVVATPYFVNKIDDLKNIYLLNRQSSNIEKYIEEFKKDHKIQDDLIKEMYVNGSIEITKNLIKMGMGYSVVPYYFIYDEIERKEIKVIHKFEESDTKFKIIFEKEAKEKDLITNFIKYLKDFDLKKAIGEVNEI